MKKVFLISFFSFSVVLNSTAQEFNCQFSVLTGQIQTSDKKIFETLQKDLYEFVNNRNWTNDQFMYHERIECSITINITNRVSTDEFEGTIQIQSRRPVYSSSYYSPMFNYIDKDLSFRYVEFQPLEFNERQNLSNLTSVVAYYVYVLLGIDYDSFSPMGGTPYFLKAQTIVNNAQNAAEKGWKAFEGTQNRYWLVEELLSPQFTPLRECIYDYHRKGFDAMTEKLLTARSEILTALKKLRKVNQDKPVSMTLAVFFLAKADEIVNIFSQAIPNDKAEVINLLAEIDPANSNKYDRIMSGK